MYSAPRMLLSVGDHRLHIHCSGQGSPTVILDAGLGGNSLHWVYVQPRVANFTRVCSYDRAGYGWSEAGPAGRTGIRNAEELHALLRAANIDGPYVLVAHSFAGYVARIFANRHAADIAGLVLVDAAHEAQFERFEAAGIRVPIAPTRRNFYIGNAYSIPDGFPPSLQTTVQALALRSNAVASLYDELAHMRDSARQVQQTNGLPPIPVAVISRDGVQTVSSPELARKSALWMSMQQDLATRFAHGRLRRATDSGHFVQLDEPQVVVAAIREMVDMNRRQGSETEKGCIASLDSAQLC